jgi:membrane-associated protease RseP (regulator of RpoE activity)
LFLFFERKKVKKEAFLFYLYRTSLGLKFIDYVGKKYKKTLRFFSYVSVIIGYVLMILSVYFIVSVVYIFTKPELVQQIKVPPIMPLIPYLPQMFNIDFLPPFYFMYWIIAIALIAISHEGFHGIFARFYGIRIKSTGFGFLGPFLAFFVEQDERDMKKAKIFPQLSILSSGVFANLILAVVFFFITILFLHSAYVASGAVFVGYTAEAIPVSDFQNLTITSEKIPVDGMTFTRAVMNNKSYFIESSIISNISSLPNDTQIGLFQDQPAIRAGFRGVITSINNKPVYTSSDLSKSLSGLKPGDKINVTTLYIYNNTQQILSYNLSLGRDYQNSSRAVLGITSIRQSSSAFGKLASGLFNKFRDPSAYYVPTINADFALYIKNLLWWVYLINLSVAIMNMLPLGLFDGGRFFYLTVLAITKKKKIAEASFKFVTRFLLIVLVLLMVLWAAGMFF